MAFETSGRWQEHPKFIVDAALLSGSAVASQCPW